MNQEITSLPAGNVFDTNHQVKQDGVSFLLCGNKLIVVLIRSTRVYQGQGMVTAVEYPSLLNTRKVPKDLLEQPVSSRSV